MANSAYDFSHTTVHGALRDSVLSETVLIGQAKGAKSRWKNVSYSLGQLLAALSFHPVGKKDGTAILQGSLTGSARVTDAIDSLELMSFDVDNGTPYDDVMARLIDVGLLSVIYTTHSHGKRVTDVSAEDLQAKADEAAVAVDDSFAARYLIEQRGYHPSVVENCHLMAHGVGANGLTSIEHNPMPKYRVVLVLKEPFDLSDDPASRKSAIKAWKQNYRAVADWLNITFDRACQDVTRLFYTPRHDQDAEYRSDVIGGVYLDLELVPSDHSGSNQAHETKKAQVGDLLSFAAKHAKAFRAAEFLEMYGEGARRNGNCVEARCPNRANHSNAEDGEDRGLYAFDAADSTSGSFVLKCHHDHCQDLDRLELLKMLLRDEEIPLDTLGDFLDELLEEKADEPTVRRAMPGSDADFDEWMAFLSENYAVVQTNKNAEVVRIEPGKPLVFLKPEAFRLLFGNKRVKVGEKGEAVKVGDAWLNHSARPTYFNTVFTPGVTGGAALNLFTGFSIAPASGDWSLLRTHIKNAICHNNSDYFDYFMTYLADIIQHPGRKQGSCIVLLGEKGAGKSIFDAMSHIIGEAHALKIDKIGSLVGKFNSHLERCIFLQVEESIWGGDKQSEGVLKNLITSDTLLIEGKGRDPYFSKNYTRVVITSNEAWVVPASADERRFFVLEADPIHRGDLRYFEAIASQMKSGGYAAMVCELMNYVPQSDLGWDQLRAPPKTKWLANQMEQSKSLHARFIEELIEQGSVDIDERAGVQPQRVKGGTIVSFRPMQLQRHFARWCEQIGVGFARGNGNPTALMTELAKRVPLVHVPDTTRDGIRSAFYDVDGPWPQ